MVNLPGYAISLCLILLLTSVRKHFLDVSFGLCFFSFLIPAQAQTEFPYTEHPYRIVFYNVENLFDTADDAFKMDEEYLPGGLRGWNAGKLDKKLNNLYKTIAGLGAWNPPAVVAMAEVENRSVLEKLIQQTPLRRFHYAIVHEESPDERGIDVALLYRPDQFEVIDYCTWKVVFPFDPGNKTRAILYVKGILEKSDTVHLIFNHWPSRLGGAVASEKYRLCAARILANKVDSVLSMHPGANLMISGDFNDEPENKSLKILTEGEGAHLINISGNIFPGTIKHEMAWAIFDQFLVTPNLLQASHSLLIKDKRAQVFSPDWLLEKDEKYAGFKPKRTYVGYRYHEGFSDHLPVYIDVMLNHKNKKTGGRHPF